ncbi:MAG TPA: sugar-transfer associated ATP-grasp domain-containing protein [Sphingomicrobium sp.]|nr:sugar-transfer associated ATP-grasp domain-containing protein [Sphingomicrobium sp.]
MKRFKLDYAVAGLPVAVRRTFGRRRSGPSDAIHDAFAYYFWRPMPGRLGYLRIVLAALTLPLLLARGMLSSTRRNGRLVAQRYGRSVGEQLRDQLHLFFRHGILPRWYYIFSLYEPGARERAPSYIHRFETKAGGLFTRLNARGRSPLNDKVGFAAHCEAHGVRTVPVLYAGGAAVSAEQGCLPGVDLFIKPVSARGGQGAERWDFDDGCYRHENGTQVDAVTLIRSTEASDGRPARLIQPRLVGDPAIADLSNGALTTCRVLTCLDEQGRPEVIAAVFRMAVGANRTVDNFHAGGIAAAVDVTSGRLSSASNIGANVRLGWLTHHPDTGAAIEGRVLPHWPETCALARAAHEAFSDRVVIGWDIGILADGPCVVEGNVGPDLDILQRMLRRGLADDRLGELVAFHLSALRRSR